MLNFRRPHTTANSHWPLAAPTQPFSVFPLVGSRPRIVYFMHISGPHLWRNCDEHHWSVLRPRIVCFMHTLGAPSIMQLWRIPLASHPRIVSSVKMTSFWCLYFFPDVFLKHGQLWVPLTLPKLGPDVFFKTPVTVIRWPLLRRKILSIASSFFGGRG